MNVARFVSCVSLFCIFGCASSGESDLVATPKDGGKDAAKDVQLEASGTGGKDAAALGPHADG